MGGDCIGLDELGLQRAALALDCFDFGLEPEADSLVVFLNYFKTNEPVVFEDIPANFICFCEIGVVDAD